MVRPISKDYFNQFWQFDNKQKEFMTKKLAAELITLRAKVGVSQEDLARAMGIPR